MAVLQKGGAEYPFWGASYTMITGLDPLGLQTTSEAIYTRLLPGVSNVTNRMRYYGFYCWLLEFYFSKKKQGNALEQNQFIRRTELLIALMMQHSTKSITQITGSSFAQKLFQEDPTGPFDLSIGADFGVDGKGTYWQYRSGAFGQYYFGALSQLSLVTNAQTEDGNALIYKATQSGPEDMISGVQMAEAFDSGLTDRIRDLLYSVVEKGLVSNTDLHDLLPYFAIDQIPTDSIEWEYYKAILLNRDSPYNEESEHTTRYRQQTIVGLLKATEEVAEIPFTSHYILSCYRKQLGTDPDPADSTEIGWYAYQLNEYWQFACGAIFWGMLYVLEKEPDGRSLYTFVDELAKSSTEYLVGMYGAPLTSESSIQAVLENTNTDWREPDWEESINRSIKLATKEADSVEVIVNGFQLLFQILKNNEEHLGYLRTFLMQHETIRDGNMVDGLDYILHHSDVPVIDFVRQFLLKKVIFRHQAVALRKLGNGTQSTLKFFLEEGYIRMIENFTPRHTSPRMGALHNLLYDLQLINDESKLTKLGLQAIAPL